MNPITCGIPLLQLPELNVGPSLLVRNSQPSNRLKCRPKCSAVVTKLVIERRGIDEFPSHRRLARWVLRRGLRHAPAGMKVPLFAPQTVDLKNAVLDADLNRNRSALR